MTSVISHQSVGSDESVLLDWAKANHGRARRALVIGLDSAAPELVFRRFAGDIPHLQGLMARALWGNLESVIPAITIPAWASSMTGCDPGELGIYGFRQRVNHGFGESRLVDSTDLRNDAVWDILSRRGEGSIVLGVPPSYPPRRVRGCMVSCFLTPDLHRPATYPRALQATIAQLSPRYAADVEGYRSQDRARLLEDIREMTSARFHAFRQLLNSQDWTFAMVVEIGLDRAHHAFWDAFDEQHPRYVRAGPFETAVRDYYRLLDREIGTTLGVIDDTTAVFVFSDHGMKRLKGGICLNEWLMREGYLSLNVKPAPGESLRSEMIDYQRTTAWAEGGHAGRIQINLRGRQPFGIVEPAARNELLDRISHGIAAIAGESGEPLEHRVYRPERIYRSCSNLAPDLIVYMGNLDYRSIGTVGHGRIHVPENDTGIDAANHDSLGMMIAHVPGARYARAERLRLIECGPSILECLGIDQK